MIDAPLSPPDLANTVTSFCTILAGATALLFCRFVGPQPARWRFAYFCLFLTGLPTFGWHGFGTPLLQVLDIGSNLLLAWALQWAVLGDFYAPATRWRVGVASGVLNALVVGWMIADALAGRDKLAIQLGDFGGFYPGEVMLILDSVLVVALMYARRRLIPDAARPLLHVVTLTFLVGLGLATAAGETVHWRWVSYHALWHVVGAFGFMVLWGFNHVRFGEGGRVCAVSAAAARGNVHARTGR